MITVKTKNAQKEFSHLATSQYDPTQTQIGFSNSSIGTFVFNYKSCQKSPINKNSS